MLTIVVVPLYFLMSILEIAAHILSMTDVPHIYLSHDYFDTHTFVHDETEYILCSYGVTWHEACVICLSYKAELATVNTDRQAQVVSREIADSDLPISDHVWIGAREDSSNSWFWISGGSRTILKNVSRRNVSLRYPDSFGEDLQCLSIDRFSHDVPIFVPLRCNQRRSFICQRARKKYNDVTMKMMSSIRVDEEEFVLYSARLTWSEAVINCRKEGLQIAEVKTTAEAQSLAFLMIQTRPETIENAWIGGYASDYTWKWLPSSSSISNNNLWRDDNRGSHGCLLLDRHVCELPVYLKAKCDRKRDVICQRPSKKPISKKPVMVYIEECLYWIGFRGLTWFQAQISCKELNASLVVLDSPKIINHMMSLMEDNGEELRHIWIDGRRKLLQMTLGGMTIRRWIWESTGESVPEIGASFLPWCMAGQCRDNDANCLNLDRASYDTPIVYGLPCKLIQTYVCQPWSGACVPRRSNVEMNSSSLHDDNDLSRPFPSAGTTTTSYYDEEVNRKALHTLAPSTINATRSPPLMSRFNKMLGNNSAFSLKSNETSDGLIFRSKHLPFRMLHGRPMFYALDARRLPYKVYLPYSIEALLPYALTYLQQVAVMIYGIALNVSFDCLVYGLIIHTCGQIELLCHRMTETFRFLRGNKIEARKIDAVENFAIVECVSHHIWVYHIIYKIQSLFVWTIAILFFFSLVTLCTSIYQMSKKEMFSPEFFTIIMYLGSMMFQAFSYCWFGNELDLKNKSIAHAIYISNWTAVSTMQRKSLMLVMMMSQRGRILSFYGIFALLLNTFTWILKTSYSAFNLLQQASS
ncbi:uncharacterized protein LOC116840255 [Odontomachus brunneus]|uniref:uncharacterized protein LOC116840255 n=1 Tax=Odontomachus brunneus TaxID=486640 RepID=UPI0013F26362|nr:uncharacterized protein LOC116840255 [Odontomachus brunneus]